MPFSVDIFETLAQQSDQNEFEADDIILFAGYTITLDEIVANGILTNLSIQFICSKTCKGLCGICGQDLNVKLPHRVCRACGYYNGKEVMKKAQ